MSQDRIYTGPIPVLPDPRAAAEPPVAGPAPLYLLADSQLLFRGADGESLVDRIASRTAPRAAYLGASNGDDPDFYAIFLAAMEPLGPAECRMIHSVPSAEELAFLDSADVVVLAGGDVERGWRAFQGSGVAEAVERRYREGAVLVGVSAGAVQLGTAGWPAGLPEAAFGTWGLAPFVVDAHAEDEDWAELQAVVRARGEGARGIGIPRGAGLVCHPDGTVEAVRRPLAEFSMRDEAMASALIFPPEEGEGEGEERGR